MNKFRNYLLATLGLGLLVGSLVFSSSDASIASQPALDVKVVNTPTQPVPTQAQGTTNIAGTVQAQQSGAWNVGINGTPDVNLASGASVGINPSSNTVQVGNDATNPVSVREGDTVLVFDQTQTVQQIGLVSFGPVDVRAYKQVRVVAQPQPGFIDWYMTPEIEFVRCDRDITEADLTRTYDVPGQAMRFLLFGGQAGPSTVRIKVYGRGN